MGNQNGHFVFKNEESIRIVMLGTAGSGKSASGNTILGQKCFKSEVSPQSLTTVCEKAQCKFNGQQIIVIDTPSVFDTKSTEEKRHEDIDQCNTYASPGPHIFLIVIRLGIFTDEEKQMMQKIQELFGEEADKYSMVLFTNGDWLKGKSIEEFLEESEDLKELVAKCSGQYHVFNNKGMGYFQRKKLLEKIKNKKKQNGGSYYTTEMFQKAKRAIEEQKQQILKEKEEENCKEQEEQRKEIEEKFQQRMNEVHPPAAFNNDDSIRIVIVGKTGAGKSATGNTILGKQCFKSEFSPKSLTTHCEKVFGEVDKEWVAVIDTPGLFYTSNTEEKKGEDLVHCLSYAFPGPHIFLIIIKLGRFTEEETQTVQKIQEIFGEEANKYSMVLFTGGDELKGKPIDEFLDYSKDLQELVAKCNNQYHVFNNELEDHAQVSELLKKIKEISKQNGGIFNTTKLLQKADIVIEEKKQEEEQNCKEQEEDGKQLREVCPVSSASMSTTMMI